MCRSPVEELVQTVDDSGRRGRGSALVQNGAENRQRWNSVHEVSVALCHS